MAKKKDPRYKTLRIVINAGGIKSFGDLFKVVPRSVVAGDLRTNNNRFYKLILKPGELTYNEAQKISRIIGCKYSIIRDLIEKEMEP